MADYGSRGRGGGFGDRGGRGRGGFGDRGRGRGGGGFPGGGSSSLVNTPMPSGALHPTLVSNPLSHGTEGRPVDLIGNFYRFTTEDIVVFHYDVDIGKARRSPPASQEASGEKSPSTGSTTSSSSSDELVPTSTSNLERFIKCFSPDIIRKLTTSQPEVFGPPLHYVYDGSKSLFTSRALPSSIFTTSPSKKKENIKPSYRSKVSIEIDGRTVDFTVKLKNVGRIDLAEMLAFYGGKIASVNQAKVQVFEQIFRSVMGKEYESFQRKFFDINSIQFSQKVQLAEFVTGFTSGVRMCEFGLALNLHLKTSCIVSRTLPKLLNLVTTLGNIQPNVKYSKTQLLQVNKFIRHLKMRTTHTGRPVTYTIDGLSEQTPQTMTFTNAEGQTISIATYFAQTYDGMVLQSLPLVRTTGKRTRMIPLELCHLVENQFLSNSKINPAIQRELLLKSTHTPNVYFNRLGSVVKKVASTEVALQRAFGIGLETAPVAFQGRVLPTPRVLNGNNRDALYRPKDVPARWGVFCFCKSITQEELLNFVRRLIDRARALGMNFGPPSPVAVVEVKDAGTLFNAFFNLAKRTQCEFIFAGIPMKHNAIPPAHIYNLVKYYGDQRFGIVSQCFSVDRVRDLPNGYFDNFLLKVNGKLGGLNAVLDEQWMARLPLNTARTMVVGVDVNHPSEMERCASSVAAAVGSTDRMFSAYAASIRVQRKEKDEIVKQMDEMMSELFEEYYKANDKTYPESVIIFRDGVSDGQFDKVLQTELPLVQAAANKLRLSSPIKITLISVQKMHHTRFALTTLDASGRRPTWNVPSGTVVDNTIVEPLRPMFYLNSHFSPLGTSRPAKYVLLRDDHRMSADTVQKLCFLLCYNSIRTRSVLAIPTPVRYADLCAYRTKLHVEAQRNVVDASGMRNILEEPEVMEADIIANLNQLVKINEKLRNKLYYC